MTGTWVNIYIIAFFDGLFYDGARKVVLEKIRAGWLATPLL
jgi:hypothetical protein